MLSEQKSQSMLSTRNEMSSISNTKAARFAKQNPLCAKQYGITALLKRARRMERDIDNLAKMLGQAAMVVSTDYQSLIPSHTHTGRYSRKPKSTRNKEHGKQQL